MATEIDTKRNGAGPYKYIVTYSEGEHHWTYLGKSYKYNDGMFVNDDGTLTESGWYEVTPESDVHGNVGYDVTPIEDLDTSVIIPDGYRPAESGSDNGVYPEGTPDELKDGDQNDVIEDGEEIIKNKLSEGDLIQHKKKVYTVDSIRGGFDLASIKTKEGETIVLDNRNPDGLKKVNDDVAPVKYHGETKYVPQESSGDSGTVAVNGYTGLDTDKVELDIDYEDKELVKQLDEHNPSWDGDNWRIEDSGLQDLFEEMENKHGSVVIKGDTNVFRRIGGVGDVDVRKD